MLLAYLAVSCVLFLVARYFSLSFPVLTPPPRAHSRNCMGRGVVGRGEDGLEDLSAK